MPDISAIAGLMGSINSLVNISKAMKDVRDGALLQSKVIELQTVILDAQSQIFAVNNERSLLIESERQLKEKVARLEAWDAEKQRYELSNIPPSSVVTAYALKPDAQPPEPLHYICTNCYQAGEKSILQPESRIPSMATVYVCHLCGADLYTRGQWQPEHAKAKRTGRRA